MNNLLVRSLTGAVFVIVVIAASLYSFWTFAGMLFFVGLIGLSEYLAMVRKEISFAARIFVLFLGTVCFFLIMFSFVWFDGKTEQWMVAALSGILAFISVMMILDLFLEKALVPRILGAIPTGVIYTMLFIPSWFLVLYVVPSWADFYPLFLGFIFLVWANDTFAYLVGRLIGKTKLFERISPKKTWEGTIGGVVFCILSAWIISMFFTQLSATGWMIMAAITSPAATLGDLVESMMKRKAGVKDSGSLLPGHGGILDRFDATIIASPIVVAFLLLWL